MMTLWYSKLCGVGIPRYISKTTRMASYTLIILKENHTNLAIEQHLGPQIWNVLGTLWVLHVNFSHKFSLFYHVYISLSWNSFPEEFPDSPKRPPKVKWEAMFFRFVIPKGLWCTSTGIQLNLPSNFVCVVEHPPNISKLPSNIQVLNG